MEKAVSNLIERVNAPLAVAGIEVRLTPAVGVAMHPADGKSSEQLMVPAGVAVQGRFDPSNLAAAGKEISDKSISAE